MTPRRIATAAVSAIQVAIRAAIRAARRVAVVAYLFVLAGPSAAYEADVHFGLTQWLARQAGFTPSQARAIAVGNFRVDSGLIATMELNLEHACVGSFPEAAADVQSRHYPSAKTVPAPPRDRVVVAGSAAARKALADITPQVIGKEGLMLSKFGEALHPLQDSWAYAGAPGTLDPGAGVRCDPAYASTHPAARGGAHPHGAALTNTHPADVMAMAAATYQALVAYPSVAGVARQPQAWAQLAPGVERFARARTKTEKRAWFVSQDERDTAFLHDTTLPDGPQAGPLEFAARMLPPLKSPTSGQYDAAADIKAFFDELFARWLGTEPVDAVVIALGAATDKPAAAAARASQPAGTSANPQLRELAARLKLWKLRDHGSAAVLAHAPAPLNAAQLKELDRLARAPGAYMQLVQPDELRNAFLPVLPKSKVAPPLLPYVVRDLAPTAGGQARNIAIMRLRHAPYDTLGFVAERTSRGWALVDIISAVDQ